MKRLLLDAWRAVTGDKRNRSQKPPEKDSEPALHSNVELAAVDATFDGALNAHQSGRVLEAQAAYRRILERAPDYAPALHFLGVSYGQSGDLLEAERLIRKSIQIQELPDYFSNLALVLDQQGKQEEVETAYRNALRLDPGNVLIHRNLGDLLVAAARHADAEQAYRGALALQPDDADTHFKLGLVLAELRRTTEAVDAYRNALSLRPAFPDAYNNLGNLLKGMLQYTEAENAYRQALLLQPATAAAHSNLGLLLQDLGRHAEAEDELHRALELQQDFAGAHNNLGNLYAAINRLPEAEASYRQALALKPDYAEGHNNLGYLLEKMDRRSESELAYRQALTFRPEYAEAWSNLGQLLAAKGLCDEAEAAHRKVLSLKPDSAIAYNNLANFFCNTNRNAEAEAAYRRALELDSDYAEARSNLGALLQDSGRIAEAEVLHCKALALKPNSALIQYNFGRLLLEMRRYNEAAAMFGRALTLQPDVAEAYDCLGTVFKEMGRYAEAEAAYRRAIALQPNAGAHINLGSVLQATERFAEAEAAYRQALMIDPEHDMAQYNLGLFCLSQKRLQEGWKGYERRWKIKDFNVLRHQFPQMEWQGEALADGKMLVWQEQGVGDVILYASMIPDLLAKGTRLIVECESRLVPLLARSFPEAQVVKSSNPVHIATLEARWQSPFGSLCRWLRARQENFTWRGPYLVPDATKISAFRERYHALGPGPVVGISWRSGNAKVGAQKSMSLLEWAPLLALGATFVNLQYGDCEEELSQLRRDTGVIVHQDDTVNPLNDLDAFAAQMAAMDLVISTSNTTVHFAGALGVPVWTLLPRGGGALLWYWFNEGEDSLWYPSMRLFRQSSPGDWPGLIARVAQAFSGYLMSANRS